MAAVRGGKIADHDGSPEDVTATLGALGALGALGVTCRTLLPRMGHTEPGDRAYSNRYGNFAP